jgi:hypothetical protein
MNRNPLASLSLDLDNKWTYMKIHGDFGWQSFPSYLRIVVPRVLGLLAERRLQITFFIVGQDAALEANAEPLAAISSAGHEVGNHSFSHEPWFHLYEEDKCEDEIARAEAHIERATGHRPLGFRGPGFSSSGTLLNVLLRRGYQYDASSFPTFFGPIARFYYFFHMKGLDLAQREQRKRLFGTFRDGFRPLRPYLLRSGNLDLVEIPVTTMPIVKLPFHLSYILYLSTFSERLALTYFQAALAMCRATRTQPSLLLHPLDFLGCDDTSDLSFFPAMSLPGAKKLALITQMLDIFCRDFTVVPMRQHAAEARAGSPLPVLGTVALPREVKQ